MIRLTAVPAAATNPKSPAATSVPTPDDRRRAEVIAWLTNRLDWEDRLRDLERQRWSNHGPLGTPARRRADVAARAPSVSLHVT